MFPSTFLGKHNMASKIFLSRRSQQYVWLFYKLAAHFACGRVCVVWCFDEYTYLFPKPLHTKQSTSFYVEQPWSPRSHQSHVCDKTNMVQCVQGKPQMRCVRESSCTLLFSFSSHCWSLQYFEHMIQKLHTQLQCCRLNSKKSKGLIKSLWQISYLKTFPVCATSCLIKVVHLQQTKRKFIVPRSKFRLLADFINATQIYKDACFCRLMVDVRGCFQAFHYMTKHPLSPVSKFRRFCRQNVKRHRAHHF